MSCGIYGIRNDINHKWYIGQVKDIETRNKNEKRNIERGYIHPDKSANLHFNRAIAKYGAKAFSFHIIELCAEELLNAKEQYYIRKYNSLSPTGYNLTEGGTSGTKGYKFTEEQKAKMSEIQKLNVKNGKNRQAFKKGKENPMYGKPSPMRGKTHTPETVAKILKNRNRSYKGELNPNYGKHASEETKAIWHSQRSGRTLSEEWKRHISQSSTKAKQVVCVETGVIYPSCVAAAKSNGINTPRNIGDVCNGKLKTAGGYTWKWDIV